MDFHQLGITFPFQQKLGLWEALKNYQSFEAFLSKRKVQTNGNVGYAEAFCAANFTQCATRH